MNQARPVQVIAVSGGKGGVGKSHIAVNLSIALAELHRRVLLLDGDLGLASVDGLLGLNAPQTLSDVFEGRRSLRDIMLTGPAGVQIVPAAAGVPRMAMLGPREHAGLIHAFSELSDQLDVLVIDTAPGLSDTVISLVRAAYELLVVVCDEPASIASACALIRVLNRDHGLQRFRILASMTRTRGEGRALFSKLNGACECLPDVTLQYVGHIPFDDSVRQAAQAQKPLLEFAPDARASRALRELAREADQWPLPSAPSGRPEFFVERLLQVATSR